MPATDQELIIPKGDHISRLQVETWSMIVEYLRQPVPLPTQNNPTSAMRQTDLARLMRTCRLFNHLAGPVLYRYVATDSLEDLAYGYYTTAGKGDRISKAMCLTYTRQIFIEISSSGLESACSNWIIAHGRGKKKDREQALKNWKEIIEGEMEGLRAGLTFLGTIKRAGGLLRLQISAHFALCPSSPRVMDWHSDKIRSLSLPMSPLREAMEFWVSTDIHCSCIVEGEAPWHFRLGVRETGVSLFDKGERTLHLHNAVRITADAENGDLKAMWYLIDRERHLGDRAMVTYAAEEIGKWIAMFTSSLRKTVLYQSIPSLDLTIVLQGSTTITSAERAASLIELKRLANMSDLLPFLRPCDKVDIRLLEDERACPACGWRVDM